MNYTLNQVRIFDRLAELESITKTAESLSLTQPAVSIQLRNFQEQFELPLTEKIGKQIHLTAFGKEVAQQCRRIIQEAGSLADVSSQYKGDLIGTLKIAVVSTGKYVMPYFLNEFLNKYEQVHLHMDVTNRDRVLEQLQSNEMDFALVSVLPDNLEVDSLELMPNQLYLVSGSDRSEIKDSASPKSLSEVPLIFRETGSATRTQMNAFLDKAGIKSTRRIELSSNEAVKQAVMANLGYSIMPLIGLKNEARLGQVRVIHMKGLPYTTHWRIIWLKSKRHLPVSAKFLEFIESHKAQIIDRHFRPISKS